MSMTVAIDSVSNAWETFNSSAATTEEKISAIGSAAISAAPALMSMFNLFASGPLGIVAGVLGLVATAIIKIY